MFNLRQLREKASGGPPVGPDLKIWTNRYSKLAEVLIIELSVLKVHYSVSIRTKYVVEV